MTVRELPMRAADTADPFGGSAGGHGLRPADRSDAVIRRDLLVLVECYSGEPGSWAADVHDGAVTIRRVHGRPADSAETERVTVRALAHAVPGVVSIRVVGARPRRLAAVPATA